MTQPTKAEMPHRVVADVAALPYFQIGGAHANRSDNFESFCCDLAISVEGLPRSTVPYGRSGQSQGGIDTKERTPLGERLGLQAKLRRPPRSPEAKVTKFWEWVDEYAANHAVHDLGRLIICTPWPNETAIIESVAAHNDTESREFVVEHWNGEVLNRFAAAHPGVVRRYFGPEWAADVAARDAHQRAAAMRLGIDEYLGVEMDRTVADEVSAEIDDRLRAWRKLARTYREAGYVGLARDAELKHVLLGLDAKHGDRRSDALRMAADAVDELQPRRAWLIGHHLRNAGGGDLGAVQSVCDALDNPTYETIGAAATSIANPDPAVDRSTLLAVGLLAGELALAFHYPEAAARIADQVRPLLLETEGSFAYARLAALLADTGIREVNGLADLDRTTNEGRILLRARDGRRAALEWHGKLAADRYGDAEIQAVECGLEGAARSARQAISRIREWMPFDVDDATGYFERQSADRLRFWSMTREFGDYPDPVRTAGLTAVEILQEAKDDIPSDSRAELVGALVLALRGGFITDEIDCHRSLAGLAERDGDPASAAWHAVWGADAKRARLVAGETTALDRLSEALRCSIPPVAIAGCAALEACAWFANGEQAHLLRDALHVPAPWKVGMGPSLGEARVKALAALGPTTYDVADWRRDAEFFDQCAPVFQLGQPIEELANFASWLIRWAPSVEERERIVETLIQSSTDSGSGPPADRRGAYEDPILQLCHEAPEEKGRLRQRWLDATGLDLYGDDTLHTEVDRQSDLSYLLALSPNDNPRMRSGYQVRPISFVNVRAWTEDECGRAFRSLLALAVSEIDSSMTRRSSLASIAGLATHSSTSTDDRVSISTDLLDLARSELDPKPSPFDNDPLLWAEAMRASASMAPLKPGDDLMDGVYGLLTNDDRRGQLLALQIVRDLGTEIAPVPIALLAAHPSWVVRWGAVRMASQPARFNPRTLTASAVDSDWRVRRRVVGQLSEIAESDHSLAVALRSRLIADRNALVRWFAAATILGAES